MATYYKYRSLQNLNRILDILINERLYAAKFQNLNDPMEGHYQYNADIDKNLKEQILSERDRTLICSLSRRANIGLMWTHYADECRGCCIELRVTSQSWREIDIQYRDHLPNLTSVEDILSVKGKAWSYEDEVRYIKTFNENSKMNYYLGIAVSKVYIGSEVSRSDFSFYKQLFEGINKFKKKKGTIIEVERMNKQNIDYGFL